MPATIVETNKDKFSLIDIDPITLDIIENAMMNARHEMDAVLFRTAMSPGIREQHDEFPMIANLEGKMVVGQFGSFIHGFKEAYNGTIEEGDLFLTTDPYACNGAISHINDWLLLRPIFKDGRLIAYAAMFGHMTDVGGKVPGSLPTDAREIFEEGIRIPPTKIYKNDELQTDLLELILHNCRMPNWNRSDFNALVAAIRTAEKRVIEMAGRFGDDVFYSALDELLARNKRAMGKLIKNTVPEKKQFFEDYICDDGLGMGPYKIKCAMWREKDKVIFDFEGTDPQSISSINFYLNEEMFKMFCGVYMIMVFDPQIMFNDGFYDLMEVKIPHGTLLKPQEPAALSCRTHALGRIFDVLGGLLGQGDPDFLAGAGFSDSPHFMYSGYDKNGEWYQLYSIGFGGVPGKPSGDGPDGHSLWPSFTNVPNEFLESYFPLRIETYETITDSGGAGYNRGGNGLRMGYCFLEPGTISIHDDRWLTYPWGVNGGEPGRRSEKILVRTDGSQERLPSKCDRIEVGSGDILYFNTWGGGGCGDPLKREVERVEFDVRAGLVSMDGAKRYGVVMNADRRVNLKRTETLRARMAQKRGKVPMFDRGGDIETLKKRCLKETGLQPPRQPEFQSWALKVLEGGKAAASGSVKVKRAAGKKAAKKTAKKAAPKPKAKAKVKTKAKTAKKTA
ncbi:MAG: hydantoinase B/oxoprolinase family protein [Luminiphilus sp.]|nr:hydantoinase B/oxoprolinase family protein [Luminiphilus sp.]